MNRSWPNISPVSRENRRRTVPGPSGAAFTKIMKNQLSSGGLSYGRVHGGERVLRVCRLVLTLAREQGVYIPEQGLNKLYTYLGRSLSARPREGLLGAWVLARAGLMPASPAQPPAGPCR